MRTILEFLTRYPFITLFLVVAGGYALGRVQIRKIGLGATASTLIIGSALSVLAAEYGLGFKISDLAGTIFFNLFMFSVGVKVGPQFLIGLRRDGKGFVIIGLFIPLVSIALMLLIAHFVDFAPGVTAGIFAGANTATPGLGAAQAAIASGTAHLPAAVSGDQIAGNLATAFAFTYCASVVLFAVMIKVPDLLGRDSVRAAKVIEDQVHGTSNAPLPGSTAEFFGTAAPSTRAVRAFRIVQPQLIGKNLGELRQLHPSVSVERVLRAGKILELADDLVLRRDDIVALYGDVSVLLSVLPWIGPEVAERTATEIGSQTVDIVVHNPDVIGKPLGELARGAGYGLFLNALFRAGDEMVFGPETVLRKGDVLRITGSNRRIADLERRTGRVLRMNLNTDIVTIALGVALGAGIGAITIPIGNLALQLGSAVGLLLVGMALSILRTRYPFLGGPYPEPARQLIEDLGLNVFVAVLGLNAGLGVVHAVEQGTIGPMLLTCVVIGFVPPILAWLLGHFVLHMNDALLLGAVAGGRCSSPGMRAAQETTHSFVPTMSYPATFAISNIVFTLATYVIALRIP